MKIRLRELKTNKETNLELPMSILELEEKLDFNKEYIIVEDDNTLPVAENTSILGLNTFLDNCRENGVDEDILSILTKANYTFEEIVESIKNDTFVIIDFTETTKNWMTPDIHNDSDKGLCMQEKGHVVFPFEYDESILDYIDWAKVWRDAECSGWRTARHDFHDYLVIAYA